MRYISSSPPSYMSQADVVGGAVGSSAALLTPTSAALAQDVFRGRLRGRFVLQVTNGTALWLKWSDRDISGQDISDPAVGGFLVQSFASNGYVYIDELGCPGNTSSLYVQGSGSEFRAVQYYC